MLALTSVVVSAIVGGLLLWWLWPEPLPPGIASQFSFYDQFGRPVSGRSGSLKLVLDPATIYANWPSQQAQTFTVDERGHRATPRRVGLPQIAVLGGSAAFGWLLSSDTATFAWQLAERAPQYDIINAAVIGYQSGQELSVMVHRLDNPDVAIYVAFDGWNDLFDTIGETTPMRPQPLFSFNNTFVVIQDRLWEYYRSQGAAHAERSRLQSPRLPNMSTDDYAALITETYLRNIDRMNAFARARGSRFLLVLQPEVGSKPSPSDAERNTLARWDELKGYVKRGFPQRYTAMRRAASEFCGRRGVPCLDVTATPEFQAQRETLFIDAVHLNERGHQLVADLIERRLRDWQ